MNNDAVIYLDMDGVLADFDSHVQKHFIGYDKYDKEKLNQQWQKIIPRDSTYYRFNKELLQVVLSVHNFWETIPLMPNANDVVEFAFKNGKNVAIITAPMNDPRCEQQKKNWIRNHFPEIKNFYCDHLKGNYVGKLNPDLDQILIDDNVRNIYSWDLNGGKGIHYKNFEGLINQWQKL